MLHEKITDELGNTVEMKIWKVPASVDLPHGYKYSLVYIVGGERVVGYDNSEGKGDHRHIGEGESVYAFKSIRRLVRDFQADVELYKEKHNEG
ncbi:MAG: DUF6516 family protein [Deltaproteobacteria bacterium]|nr:DUF6516 family protein [Deltaproteobacteria bacterium]